MKHISQSEFANSVADHVYGKRQGDAKILVDAQDSKTGLAKTSCAIALARLFARAFDYELKKDDLTLSGAEYLKRYQEQPGAEQPSVLVLDELVGAGSGDARRSMSTSNVNLTRAWELQRVRRCVTICTLADFSDADRRLKKLADFRCMTLRKPFGAFKAYDLGTFFSEKSGVKYKRLDENSRIFFPDMADDPLYEHLADKKMDLLESDFYDADKLQDNEDEQEDQTPQQLSETDKERIRNLYNNTDLSQDQLADNFGVDRTYVSKIASGKV